MSHDQRFNPTPEEVQAGTVDTRAMKLDNDPYSGAPRRMERRSVFGHLTGEYRVSVMQPATLDDILAGRAERMDPKDDDSPMVVWKALCEWTRLTEQQELSEWTERLDPNRMLN